MVINTPCFWTDFFSDIEDGDSENLLSQDTMDDMKHLLNEVEKYISGERAQSEFYFSGEKASLEKTERPYRRWVSF